MFHFGGSSCLLGFNSLTSQCCGQGKWRFCAQFYPQAWRTPYIPPHWLVKGVFVILFHLYTQPLDSKYFFKEIFFAKNSSCNLCTYFLISLSSRPVTLGYKPNRTVLHSFYLFWTTLQQVHFNDLRDFIWK